MGGNFTRVNEYEDGDTLTEANYEGELDNIIANMTPVGLDDQSSNDAAMQSTADPYPGSVISKPTDLAGELKRLRYVLKQITGQAQWYIDPAGTMVDNTSAQNIAGAKTFTDVMRLSGTNVKLNFYDSDAAVDNKIFGLVGNGNTFYLLARNDVEDDYTEVFTATRADMVVTEMDIKSTDLLHNGVAVPTISSADTLSNKILASPVINTPSSSGEVYSDTYNASITGTANIDNVGSTAGEIYTQIGNVVYVSMQIYDLDVTAITTFTDFRVTLPVASNLVGGQDLNGTASINATGGSSYAIGRIYADSTNNEARINFYSLTASTHTLQINFAYKIIT